MNDNVDRLVTEKMPFRGEDLGWVVINIGMGIGAGIAMLPVEVGMKGLGVFLIAALIGYPSMYLFQRLFINSLMVSKTGDDYTDIVSHALGKNVGLAVGGLYFAMLAIWYFVYSDTVVRDSASYLQNLAGAPAGLDSSPLYAAAIVGGLTAVAGLGARLLFRISGVVVITVLALLLLLGFAMIPQWADTNVPPLPASGVLLGEVVVTLPFVLTSILFIQSLGTTVFFFRTESDHAGDGLEVARRRSLRCMNVAYIVLFSVVFFYAVSFSLSLSVEQATAAYEGNVSALAIAAQSSPNASVTVLSVVLDIFSVLGCFLAVTMALRGASRGLVRGVLKRLGRPLPDSRRLDWAIAIVLIGLAVGNVLVGIKILWLFLICSPIFGIIGCFVPSYMVWKVPELRRFRSVAIVPVIIVGVLLCASPFVALF